jgi:hypothetical protein
MFIERRSERRERGLQFGAKTRNHRNDRYRSSRHDQAVPDRRCSVLSSLKNLMIRRMRVAFSKIVGSSGRTYSGAAGPTRV